MATVVYRTTPGESVLRIVRMLEAGGFTPEVLDDPDPDPVLRHACQGTYAVRIAVPDDQAERAGTLLAESERGREARVEDLAREFRLLILQVIAFGGAAACVLRLLVGNWEEVPWQYVVVTPIIILVIMSHVRAIRRHRPRE